MANYIPATPSKHEISIIFTLYDKFNQKTKRSFSLRNLSGESLEEQIQESQVILNEVAGELYHITSAGLDIGEIKVGRKK